MGDHSQHSLNIVKERSELARMRKDLQRDFGYERRRAKWGNDMSAFFSPPSVIGAKADSGEAPYGERISDPTQDLNASNLSRDRTGDIAFLG